MHREKFIARRKLYNFLRAMPLKYNLVISVDL